MISLPPVTIAAFGALTLALIGLWASRVGASPIVARAWMLPGALALVLALAAGLIDYRGLLALLAFAAASVAAPRATNRRMRVASHAILVIVGTGLFLHVLPGIDNPRLVSEVVLGPGALPYTKYLNFDKAFAGLCLLGLYAPDRPATDAFTRHIVDFLWRFIVVIALGIGLAIALGFVQWDPKQPTWWGAWLWSMVFLTALPEEALFRGVLQTRIAELSRRDTFAMIVAGLLFGAAHFAGGVPYVILAAAIGIGYGWIYASTRSIAAAIVAHAGLNTVQFFFFTYPALGSLLAEGSTHWFLAEGAIGTFFVSIAAERALYWTSGGVFWAAGTNATATRLP